MQKIIAKIDVSLINKSKIEKNVYKNKEGVEVVQMLYPIEIVEKQNTRTIKEGDGWVMKETHFICEAQNKEEREAKTKTPILGNGIQFMEPQADNSDAQSQEEYDNYGQQTEIVDDVDPSLIPF